MESAVRCASVGPKPIGSVISPFQKAPSGLTGTMVYTSKKKHSK